LLFLRNLLLDVFQFILALDLLEDASEVVAFWAGCGGVFIFVKVKEGLAIFGKILMDRNDIWLQYCSIVFLALILNFSLVVVEDFADTVVAWLARVTSCKQVLISLKCFI